MDKAMMRYGRASALVLVGAPIMAIAVSSQAQNTAPSRAQKVLKIVMVPKFTGTAYFAATEKGAGERKGDVHHFVAGAWITRHDGSVLRQLGRRR